MRGMRAILIVVSFLLLPASAMAAGIELREHSAAAQGRVLAVTARMEDSSTVFFNVAGLAYLRGLAIQVGDTIVVPDFTYEDARTLSAGEEAYPSASTSGIVPPPHAYLSYGMDLGNGGGLGFGLGVNFPFGLTLVWPDDFVGRHLISETALQIPEIYAGVAWSPVSQVSIGASLVVAPASVYIKKYLGKDFGLVGDDGKPLTDATVEMGGSGFGIGFNAGIQARPVKDLYLGFQYRSRMTVTMDGDAHFELDGLTDRSGFQDQEISTEFKLPDIFALGIGYQITKAWYAEIDVDYTLWSVFTEIPINFPKDTTGQLTQSIQEDWKDGFTFRFGNEIKLTDKIPLRAGIGYDQSPARDELLTPMLPDANRLFMAIGSGYEFDFGMTLDVSYQFTRFEERTVTGQACTATSTEAECAGIQTSAYDDAGAVLWSGNPFPATYKNFAHLTAITLGYKF